MHVLSLGVPLSLQHRLLEESIQTTAALHIDDLRNLASLDRRNNCYQFDVVLIRVREADQVLYPYVAYLTGIRVPIIIVYDERQFAAIQCAEWYRHGVVLCVPETAPFDLIRAAIQSLVHFNQRVDHRLVAVGTVRIDTVKKEVFADEESVLLTPYEYRVLELLARRRNRHVRSEDIFYEMCGRDEDRVPDDAIVKVYVSKLRKALRRHQIESIEIKTAYGFGYRLIEREQRA